MDVILKSKTSLVTAGFFLLLFLSFCSFKVKDIIQPINLTAGIVDTVFVQDMFYAPEYNLEFEKNSRLTVEYLSDKNLLVLKSAPDFSGITLLNFNLEGETYSIPVTSKIPDMYSFKFKPEPNTSNVFLMGTFNSWDRSSLPITDESGDGIYEIRIPLEPGKYEYKYFVDGEELLDPSNPVSAPNGIGGYNSILNISDKNKEFVYLHLDDFIVENSKFKFKFIFEIQNSDFIPASEDVIAILNNKPLAVENISLINDGAELSIDRKLLTDDVLLRISVNTGSSYSNIQNILLNDGKPVQKGNDSFNWYDGVIYSLLVDRFNDGDTSLNKPVIHDSLSYKANYMGGDLKGILDKLNEGYFDSLGVNIIWISPVNQNPDEAFREYPEPHRWFSGYHGYWPIHHKEIENQFGNMNDLKIFIKTAHQHGIKVLLDFVSNHVHEQHVFFKEHPEWFGSLFLPDGRKNLRFWDEFRLTTWFEPYLPSFDYLGSEEAIEAMTDNAVWWLQTTHADGFRHDAVKHVPNKFWRALTRKLKEEIELKENRKVYQIGETFGNYDLVSSYVNNGQLDAQFNFNLYNIAQTAFIDPAASFEDLDRDIKKTQSVYSGLQVMGNIMDSHDKNRYIAYADGDLELWQWNAVEEGWNNPPEVNFESSYFKTELYLAYMMTIPGLPVIYYGSEFGMTGASDPDNRRMMRFGDKLSSSESGMLEIVQKLVSIRNNHSALRYGDFYTLQADTNSYSYIRSDLNERILVVLNKSESDKKMSLNIPEFYRINSATDLYSGEKIEIKNNLLECTVSPIGYKIFTLISN